MQRSHKRNWSITHTLNQHQIQQKQFIYSNNYPHSHQNLLNTQKNHIKNIKNQKSLEYSHSYSLTPYNLPKNFNILKQRSRKHRLIEERNTQIEKRNRLLMEKIRKIKMKNTYQHQIKSEKIQDLLPQESHVVNRGLMFPQLQNSNLREEWASNWGNFAANNNSDSKQSYSSSIKKSRLLSMNSTKSHLTSILEDRITFVEKYFTDLKEKKAKKVTEQQLGIFSTENGWKIKVLLVDGENLLLIGKKGRQQLTKKYIYSRVKEKMINGLEQWVKGKFIIQK